MKSTGVGGGGAGAASALPKALICSSCLQHPASLCISTRTLFTRCCRQQCVTAMNVNDQWSPKTEQFMTAKIIDKGVKTWEENTFSTASAQFTAAKIRGCTNVSSHSSRAEGMRLGWRTPRVYSLKLANLHKD